MTTAKVRRITIVAAAMCLAATASGLLWFIFRGQPSQRSTRLERPDPRLEYTGPFRNVHPGVRYVQEARCARCHAAIAATYFEHPMGRSLRPITEVAALAAGVQQNNPFQALGTRFRAEYEGNQLRHKRTRIGPAGDPAAEQTWEVHYVIGSGTRGYSYLTDQEGYLFQTPMSWYAQKQAWDLSPGFGLTEIPGRAVTHDCLFCHANRANAIADSVNHYTEPVFDGFAIGCQRCHGPGELHVADPGGHRGDDGIDLTIVNPRHLSANRRQAVCEQCHLQGMARTLVPGRELYDFRPGLALEAFWSVFVRAPEAGEVRKAVGQVEQMYQSRCFQGSAGPGRLGCVSCHNPHERVAPEQRIAHYRARCLNCHQQRGCSLPLADRVRKTAEDSCIDCHMPGFGASDIPHTAATDHRVPRGGRHAPAGDVGPGPGDGLPIVSVFRGRTGVDDADDDRSRAVAMMQLTLQGDAAAGRAARYVLPALEAARRRDPDDLSAAEALGYALGALDRAAEALAIFEAILARAPERESTLVVAAMMAATLGRTDAALGFWRRAVAVNPWSPTYRRNVVLHLVKQEAWDAALPQCEAWTRLDPMSAEARAARVGCLLALGNKTEARAEFARIVAIAPTNLRELQIRFDKKLR